jgi:hypothetical protein
VPEFVAYAKAHPGRISMASPGIGSSPYMSGELFKFMAAVDMVHVPYRSSPNQRRHWSGRLWLVYGLDAIENPAETTHCELNVIVGLQVEPKLRRCAERLAEPKRGIGGDASLLAGNPLDPSARQTANFGKSARRHFERNKEFLPQNLTGMHRLELLGHCGVRIC